MKTALFSTSTTAQSMTSKTVVVFIDAGVDNYQHLVNGVLPTADVFVLDALSDGVEQISSVLRQYEDVDAVHIVSHGAPGCLYVGNSPLSLYTLDRYAPQLKQWNTANLLLYGCNVAAGDAGAEFISKLKQLTSANIAAATHRVGHASRGGNWQLQHNTGETAAIAFMPKVVKEYTGVFADVTFDNGTDFAIQGSPFDVAVGDFDGDGKVDLATADLNNNTVAVLLNDGAGGFSNATNITLPTGSDSIVVGDFNGDRHLDIATVSSRNHSVNLLLNDGNGGFSLNSTFQVGIRPWSLATGDFNGDNRLDIATANSGGSVSVLINNGQGGFNAASNINMNGLQSSIAVGDFNGDNKLDLVTTNYFSASVSLLLNDGSGSFTPTSTLGVGSYPRSVTVEDFNGDGRLDIAAVNSTSNVSVLLNNGSGGFNPGSTAYLGVNSFSLATGDFNSDEKLDLITANYGRNSVSMLLNDGAGNFNSVSTFAVDNLPSAVAVEDFNDDGLMDFVTTRYQGSSVRVFLNTTEFNLPPTAINDSVITTEDASVIINVLTNDTDPNRDPLTVTSVNTTGMTGTVTQNGNLLTYNPGNAFQFLAAGETATTSFSYSISDGKEGTSSANVTVTIQGVNDAPTALSLSNNRISENIAASTTVGTLTSSDPDTGNTFTYQLVTGTGSIDNSAFTIVGNQLRINASPDFEAKDRYSIRVRTTDQGGASYEEAFTVNVNNVNEQPTDISLAGNSVAENEAGAVIGAVTVADPDSSEFTLTVDDSRFEVVKGQLKLKDGVSLDFETEPSVVVNVTATDDGTPAGSLIEEFTIRVSDVEEVPILNGLAATVYVDTNDSVVGGQRSGETYSGTLWDTPLDDVIVGTQGRDTVRLMGGNDQVNASGGDDLFRVHSGTNVTEGGSGDDSWMIFGGSNIITDVDGSDKVTVRGGENTINSGVGGDTISLEAGINTVNVGSGSDRLFLRGGDNVVDATADDLGEVVTFIGGNNVVRLGNGENILAIGGGNNTVTTGSGDDKAYRNGVGDHQGSHTLNLGEGNNRANLTFLTGGVTNITTGSGDDVILTGASNDIINSGAGNDLINVGLGTNRITTGAGADTIQIEANGSSITVTDFTVGEDRLLGYDSSSWGAFQRGADTLLINFSSTPTRIELLNVNAAQFMSEYQ